MMMLVAGYILYVGAEWSERDEERTSNWGKKNIYLEREGILIYT